MGFFIFLAAVQAELTQPPFDMPVAESEIVGGYQVEYTGFRFLLFFLAEFATAVRLRRHRRRSCSSAAGAVPRLRPDRRHHQRPRARRAVRQGDVRLLPHLLGPVHVPPVP